MGNGSINVMSDWDKTRRRWREMNPPNHQGYYICGICGQWVNEKEMEVDHIKPRGGSSLNLKHDLNNLQPAHAKCNRLKGSKRNFKYYGNM